jgi:phage baseplate assembly protein W
MSKISFKSVGVSAQAAAVQIASTQSSPTPIGIKTPLQLGGSDGIFVMNYDLADQLADNLRNLLLTNWGERVGQYFLGANLRPLTTEFVSQDSFDNEAVVRIKNAVGTWMPYVNLIDFISEVDRTQNNSTGVIKVTITYSVQALKIENKKIQIFLYIL